VNQNLVGPAFVVNGKRETFGQQAMEPHDTPVNSCVQLQGINIGKQRLHEVFTHPEALTFVKGESVGQVIPAPRAE
jgi:hypothetical protein